MYSSRLIPVEGHEGLARDSQTAAIINTIKSDFLQYKVVSAARKQLD